MGKPAPEFVPKPADQHGFGIPAAELFEMNAEKDMEKLKAQGGVTGLAKALRSDPQRGLDEKAVHDSTEVYGANRYKEVPAKSFFRLAYETAQDPIIILLMVAATVSTVLGAAIPDERHENGWIEGVAIWVAVFVVIGVGAGNDWQKDQQFRKLNAQREAIKVKVIRDGKQAMVDHTSIVVGDIMLLDTGDKIIADGIAVESFGLVLDEAALTGEGDPIKKNVDEDPWIRSGTQITDGSGRMLVSAVGPQSEWGKIMAMVGEAEDQQTPLQEKLEVIATAVGKIGLGVAVACFIALLIKWCVANNGFPIKRINDNGPVQFFLYAVTIIVVAVPEGLPLAVTIALAYSMKKMMKDNNFVRILAACETMGGATAICSDKTGTLTENRMTVVRGWFCGTFCEEVPEPATLPQDLVTSLSTNVAMTSKAFLIDEADGKITFVGNRTECALLMLLRKWGIDYKEVHAAHEKSLFRLFGFSSERKMSCCILKEDSQFVVYNKGAAEWVLRQCKTQMTPQGQVIGLSEDEKARMLEDVVTRMAKVGLRCIALTRASLPLEAPGRSDDFFDDMANVDGNLTLLAIVGIKDPVRAEVPDAVRTCQGAGIIVRMVTGDNIHTAKHIARECGILPEGSDYIALEGPVFRRMSEEELKEMLPRMRVLARSSPEDKRTLVRTLRSMGEVVAVTGDGTNDAAALKAADVGLAMGIAGTEVAKEAADIIIMDDNFSSIVKSVLWGRSVFTNIRKFLQFQLTVNFVALVTAFFGAVIGGTQPLNVLQLLWVNMIMDSMGALALATEKPTMLLLRLRPYGRDEQLVSGRMWLHIVGQGLYQLFWMFVCLYALPKVIPSRYGINRADYYNDHCSDRIGSLTGDATLTSQLCNIINQCGFPEGGATRQTPACSLYAQWAPSPVPDDQLQAVCGAANAPYNSASGACPLQSSLTAAQANLDSGYSSEEDHREKERLSVLFNAFIMMQVANEIACRRIYDEYDFFVGLYKEPIFLAVIIITLGLQAIIINFLGTFFKTVPLDWKEWLATIAMGVGAWPVSWFIRAFTRYSKIFKKADERTGVAHMYDKELYVYEDHPVNGNEPHTAEVKGSQMAVVTPATGAQDAPANGGASPRTISGAPAGATSHNGRVAVVPSGSTSSHNNPAFVVNVPAGGAGPGGAPVPVVVKDVTSTMK